jgi:hypothetical protein
MACALLLVLFILCTAQAQDGAVNPGIFGGGTEGERGRRQSLSLGFSAAIAADLCAVGAAIIDVGVADLNKQGLPYQASVTKLLMSDKDMALLKYASYGTNAGPLQLVQDFQAGGPLVGVDFGFYAMYDFLEWLNLPLFVRFGFDYVSKISGGEQYLILGSGVDQIASASGYPNIPGGYGGARCDTTWGAGWMEVPFSFGVIWEFADVAKVYAGLGMSWFKGGFSVDVKMNPQYTAFLTSFKDNADRMVVEPVNEHIAFTTYGFTLNMFIGMEVFVWKDVAVTAEYWASGMAKTVYAETEFSDTAQRAMTMCLAGPAAASQDDRFIERFAYPVVLGGTMVKFGAKYYFDSLIGTYLL